MLWKRYTNLNKTSLRNSCELVFILVGQSINRICIFYEWKGHTHTHKYNYSLASLTIMSLERKKQVGYEKEWF